MAPASITESEIAGLREHGWTDESIHLATQIVGYFNYINRIANGLDVDHEAWMQDGNHPGPQEWLQAKAAFRPQS